MKLHVVVLVAIFSLCWEANAAEGNEGMTSSSKGVSESSNQLETKAEQFGEQVAEKILNQVPDEVKLKMAESITGTAGSTGIMKTLVDNVASSGAADAIVKKYVGNEVKEFVHDHLSGKSEPSEQSSGKEKEEERRE